MKRKTNSMRGAEVEPIFLRVDAFGVSVLIPALSMNCPWFSGG